MPVRLEFRSLLPRLRILLISGFPPSLWDDGPTLMEGPFLLAFAASKAVWPNPHGHKMTPSPTETVTRSQSISQSGAPLNQKQASTVTDTNELSAAFPLLRGPFSTGGRYWDRTSDLFVSGINTVLSTPPLSTKTH